MPKKETKTSHKREVEALNAHADYFNSEMEDVLQFQAETEPGELESELPDESAIVPTSNLDLEK